MDIDFDELKNAYNRLVVIHFYDYNKNYPIFSSIGYYTPGLLKQNPNKKKTFSNKKVLELNDNKLRRYNSENENMFDNLLIIKSFTEGINNLSENNSLFITPDLLYFLKYTIEEYIHIRNYIINPSKIFTFITDTIQHDNILLNGDNVIDDIPKLDSLYKYVEQYVRAPDGRGSIKYTENNQNIHDFYKLVKYSEGGVYTYLDNKVIKLRYHYSRRSDNRDIMELYKRSTNIFLKILKESNNSYMNQLFSFDYRKNILYIDIEKPKDRPEAFSLENVNNFLQKIIFTIDGTNLRTLCKVTGHGPRYKFYLNSPKDNDDLNITTGINHPIVKYVKNKDKIQKLKYCGCGTKNYLDDTDKKQCVKNACELEILRMIEDKIKYLAERAISADDVNKLNLRSLNKNAYDINRIEIGSITSNKYYIFMKYKYLNFIMPSRGSFYVTRESYRVNGKDIINYNDRDMLSYILKKCDRIISGNNYTGILLDEAMMILFMLEINNLNTREISEFINDNYIMEDIEDILFLCSRLFNIRKYKDFENFFKRNSVDYWKKFSAYQRGIIKKYIGIT